MAGRLELWQHAIEQLEFAAESNEIDVVLPIVFAKQVGMVADLAQLHQRVHQRALLAAAIGTSQHERLLKHVRIPK